MRAAILTEHGGAPRPDDRPEPTRSPGRTLVRVRAVPITPLDVLCASGTSYFGAPPLPYVPGVQGVGVVAESQTLAAGTRVWFPTTAGMAPGDGSMAELAVVDDGDLVEVGGALDDLHLAALGLSAMAAWTALLDRGAMQPGERVLVLGSSGVVGRVAVRAAVLRGASAVFAAAIEPWAEADAIGLGADRFVSLADAEDVGSLADRMRDVVGQVDVVLDPLCGAPASAALLCLAPRGRLVNLGSSAAPTAEFSSASLRSGSRTILGYTNNDLTGDQRRSAMAEIVHHADAGRLAVPYEAFPLEQAYDAWRRHCNGEVRGRAVVDLTGVS
jgi:NADPH:quinone reductase-like Zn-dependent oxidoreductase